MASLPPSLSIPSGRPNRDAPRQPAARQFPAAMKLPPFFEEDRLTVDAALERLLPAQTAPPSSVHTAMRYSVFAGGKRIRPILCLETARIFTSDVTPALHPACALEFIHTYSLIHDDLPALDNDDLRRCLVRGCRPRRCRAPAPLWRNHRLGLSGHRRHSGRRRILRRAWQDRGKRHGTAKGHLSVCFRAGTLS